jgi:trehalose/maltose hydrolase-like predicted phosphorylase
MHWSEITKSFLLYRYRRLEAAKKLAIEDEKV